MEAAAIVENQFDVHMSSSSSSWWQPPLSSFLRLASWVWLWSRAANLQDKKKERTNQPSNNLSRAERRLGGMCVGFGGVLHGWTRRFGGHPGGSLAEDGGGPGEEDVFQVYTTARELHRKTNNPLFESYLTK